VTTWLAIGRLRQFREAEEGRVRALTLLLLGVAMLVVGLGVDVGFLRYQNQQMQNAADLGAIAGASALILGGLVRVADQNAGDVPLKGAVLLSYPTSIWKASGANVRHPAAARKELFSFRGEYRKRTKDKSSIT